MMVKDVSKVASFEVNARADLMVLDLQGRKHTSTANLSDDTVALRVLFSTMRVSYPFLCAPIGATLSGAARGGTY